MQGNEIVNGAKINVKNLREFLTARVYQNFLSRCIF